MVSGWVRRLILLALLVKLKTDYRDDFLSYEDVLEFADACDLFLGPAKDLTSKEPVPNPLNSRKLIGGTAFERCGQWAIKESGRCYSLTMTHQRQRALVGPSSSGKFYNNSEDSDSHDYSLNLQIRQQVTKVRKIYQIFQIYVEFLYYFYY